MTCLTCANSAIRDRSDAKRDEILRAFNRMGRINCCKSSGRATFYPMNHNCAEFEPAQASVIAARESWAAALSSAAHPA